MLKTTGRVFSGLQSATLSRGRFIKNTSTTVSVRPVVLSPLTSAKSKPPTDEETVNEEPIKFSTSKASHRTWKVEHSMGSQYERPWWKVVPIMLLGSALLLWCFLREETDIDAQLNKHLYERLPGLLSDEEAEQVEKK
ncbi:protein CCSMST1 [Nematolebias whitei]|uniref:protein CCSMST1 n=1 Tax=Nematolebias whitei TaxID=451745 RepID=UPI0018990E95|nr:protein CCSMST1 [Nematolebias whitei]